MSYRMPNVSRVSLVFHYVPGGPISVTAILAHFSEPLNVTIVTEATSGNGNITVQMADKTEVEINLLLNNPSFRIPAGMGYFRVNMPKERYKIAFY